MNPGNRLRRIGKLYAKLNQGLFLASKESKFILVCLGAALASAGQLIPDPASGLMLNRFVGMLGVFLAFVGGWWTMRAEKHAPQALEEARLAIQDAMQAEASTQEIRRRAEEIFRSTRRSARHQRQLLNLANVTMKCAHLLNQSPLTLEERLAKLLQLSERPILGGIQIDGGERWTLSIYVPRGDDLVRVAAACADRNTNTATGRPWKIGQGFVGAAYQRKGDLVLADAQTPQVQAMLNVPMPLPSDPARYRSVAAIAVQVDGDQGPPWGIVIGTSDKKGRFDDAPRSEGAANAEAIKIFASVVALLISGAHIANKEPNAASATKRPRPIRATKRPG